MSDRDFIAPFVATDARNSYQTQFSMQTFRLDAQSYCKNRD